MHLYIIRIKNMDLGQQTYYVSAKDARGALEAAYKKCDKALKGLPDKDMYIQHLTLVQENW